MIWKFVVFVEVYFFTSMPFILADDSKIVRDEGGDEKEGSSLGAYKQVFQ